MDLYRAIKQNPVGVWSIFESYPSTKHDYYRIRNDEKVGQLDLIARAARTLYLNRTCFRGWWRYNAQGQFNVGYGGQGRRWAITKDDLVAVSCKLANATLQDGDFENVINSSQSGDFVFADPPYQPGERGMSHEHYVYSQENPPEHPTNLDELVSELEVIGNFVREKSTDKALKSTSSGDAILDASDLVLFKFLSPTSNSSEPINGRFILLTFNF